MWYLKLCSLRLRWEPADRVWYKISGKLLRLRYGDDGRWGDYDLDRNPPPSPPRLCTECAEEVEIPGNHYQINDDYYHLTCKSGMTAESRLLLKSLDGL